MLDGEVLGSDIAIGSKRMVVEPVALFEFSSVSKGLDSAVTIADCNELGAVETAFGEEEFSVGYSVFLSICKELEYVLIGSVGAFVEYADIKSSVSV